MVGGVLLCSGATEIYYSYQENEQALLVLQREKAQAAAARIEQYIGAIVDDLQWSIVPPFADRDKRAAQQRIAYLTLLRKVPAITEITHLDRKGKEQMRISRLRTDAMGSGDDHHEAPEFIAASAGSTYFGRVSFRGGTEPFMRLGVAGRGVVRHVTLADVNLKFIWDIVSSIDVGKSGTAFVVDAAGNLIAHPDLSLVLARSNFANRPRVRSAIAGLRGAADAASTTATAGAGAGAGASAVADSKEDDSKPLSGVALIAPIGWAVFVEQPRSVGFAPLWASVQRSGMVLLAGLALALMASIVLARRMVAPIQMLEAGAARIGEGQLDHRINVHTGDEVEGLAVQFNSMAERLQESYSTLERRVEERTHELSEALEELQRTSSELETANRHKSEFLANMSHELRTPLNAVIGFSEVLGERMFGELNDKQAEYVQDIHASGRHLLSLINDILDLSKIEAGAMELDVSRFALAAALDNALTLIRERAASRGLTLEMNVDSELGEMEGDERKLKQILLNLLSNAIKFTAEGGTVTLEARQDTSHVYIGVRDTGVGISKEDQSVIFEEFRQVGTDYARKAEGTGLGLALTMRFVQMHGGRLSVESEPGVGSVFKVELPLQPVETPA
jgi:signal transduction histidine kinase